MIESQSPDEFLLPGMDNDRDILLVSIFTFLTIVLWVFFELVKTAKTSTTSTSVQQLIVPFQSTLDTDILKSLKDRKTY